MMEQTPQDLIRILQLLQLHQQLQNQERPAIDNSAYSMQDMGGTAAQSTPTPMNSNNIGGSGSGFGGFGEGGTQGNEISQQATDRAMGTGLSGLGNAATKAAQSAMMAGQMGFDPIEGAKQTVLANPKSLLGIGPEMGYSQAGIQSPGGFFGGLMSAAPSALAGLLGLTGPLGAAAGMLGTPFADMMGDVTGLRDLDSLRDDIESEYGQIGGRTAYSDAMTGLDEYSQGALAESDPATVQQGIDNTKARLGTSQQMTPANLEANVNLQSLVDALLSLQNPMTTNREIDSTISNIGTGISNIGNVGNTSLGISDGIGNTNNGSLGGSFGSSSGGFDYGGSLGTNAPTGGFDYGSVDPGWGWGGFDSDNDNDNDGSGGDGSGGRAGGPDSDAESTGF